MTRSLAAPSALPRVETESAPGAQTGGDIDDLLAAIAVSCRESVARFEDAVGQITEIVVNQVGCNDNSLIMALQNFDRLHQEFATLGEVVARVSARGSGPQGVTGDGFCHEVIASVNITELQERLAYHFRARTEDPGLLDDSEDVEF